jgi:hypothetical protein
MAQPHEYAGLGGLTKVDGESYEESYQAQPFNEAGTGNIPADAFVPGRPYEQSISYVSTRVISDDGMASEDSSGNSVAAVTLTIKSENPGMPPHVEYGRISEN